MLVVPVIVVGKVIPCSDIVREMLFFKEADITMPVAGLMDAVPS